jgi:hypothetical protein
MSINFNNLINNLIISAGNPTLDSFYSLNVPNTIATYGSNVNQYLNTQLSSIQAGTQNSFNSIFGAIIQQGQINALVTNSIDIKSLWKNPYAVYLLANLSDDDFLSVLNTGVIGSTNPNYISNVSSSANTSNNNFTVIPAISQACENMLVGENSTATTASIINTQIDANFFNFIGNNIFSITMSYPGYVNGNNIILNFSQDMSTTPIIANCLGLLILLNPPVGNSSYNLTLNNNQSVLLGLIQAFSNVQANFTTNNSIKSAGYQGTSSSYYNNFSTLLNSSVTSLEQNNIIQSSRHTLTPTSISSSPIVSVGNEPSNVLVIASGSLLTPSGITLNQFTEPTINQAQSILDIIRNPSGYPVNTSFFPLSGSIFAYAGSIVPTPAPVPTGCISIAFSQFSASEKQNIISALENQFQTNKKSLEKLFIDKNSQIKDPNFTIALSIAGILPPNTKISKSNLGQGWQYWDYFVGNSQQNGKTASSINNILNTTWNNIQPIPASLYAEIGIIKPSGVNQISESTLANIKVALSGTTCGDLNSVLQINNNGGTNTETGNITNETQNLSQDQLQQAMTTNTSINDIQNQNCQILTWLQDLNVQGFTG